MSKVTDVRKQYIDEGYECIPLRPNSKLPLSKNWQKHDPFRQWQTVEDKVNFGLRAGNGKAFIDCDNKNDPGTFTNVSNWLAGLGYAPGSYPVIQTASGIGRHVYVNFTGSLLGNFKNFTASMGKGEFRFASGAYVAAPPSVVENGRYNVLEGDTAQLPTLDISDIGALINVSAPAKESKNPVMSTRAVAIAQGNEDIIRDQYNNDRSRAEAGLMLSLINSGFEFPQIQAIFEAYPCAGHYREAYKNPKHRAAYLERTYQEMLKCSERESDKRRKILEIQQLADRHAWHNANDKLVFLAHTQIAFNAGRFEYAASRRDLALGAGVGSGITATNATRRLIDAKLLSESEKSVAMYANRYLLNVDKIDHFLTSSSLGSGQFCPAVVVEAGKVVELDKLETADVFRNGKGRLGRRAGQVYRLLFTGSFTEVETADRIGASVKTIQRVLKKLHKVLDHKTGEVIEMVSSDTAGRWHSNIVDLELVEAIYSLRGATEKQRREYERERREHRKQLELGKLIPERTSG